jgi:hypothetical protein
MENSSNQSNWLQAIDGIQDIPEQQQEQIAGGKTEFVFRQTDVISSAAEPGKGNPGSAYPGALYLYSDTLLAYSSGSDRYQPNFSPGQFSELWGPRYRQYNAPVLFMSHLGDF